MLGSVVYIRVFIVCLFLILPVSTAWANEELTINFVVTEKNKSIVELKNVLKENLHYKNVNIISLDSNPVLNVNKKELYIADGYKTLNYLIKAKVESPVIAILISRILYQRIITNYQYSEIKNISAIFSDPSPVQQMALVKSLYGKYPTVGFLGSDKTNFIKNEIVDIAKKMSVSLKIVEHLPNDDIHKTINKLGEVDVLMAFPDSNVYNSNTYRKIILSTYHRGHYGIIGFSPQFVNSGGIATIYYNKTNIADRLDQVIKSYLQTSVLMPPSYPDKFSLKTNQALGRSLNVIIPEDEKLLLEINSFLGRRKHNE